MAVPTLANTWRASVEQKIAGHSFYNVIHVTAPTLANPTDVATDVGVAWRVGSGLKSIQSSAVTYGTVNVQPYDGSSAPTNVTVSSFTGTTGAGGASGAGVQQCALITLRTLLSGRAYRGRMYIPGIDATYKIADGSQWTSAFKTTLQTAADAFRTSLLGGTAVSQLVVYSAKNNTKASVSTCVARQYFGTQRRRAESFM